MVVRKPEDITGLLEFHTTQINKTSIRDIFHFALIFTKKLVHWRIMVPFDVLQ